MSSPAVVHPSRGDDFRFSSADKGLVSRALSFLGRMLKPSAAAQQAARENIVSRKHARTAMELYRIAGQYDSVSPALSAELRFLATHGNQTSGKQD